MGGGSANESRAATSDSLGRMRTMSKTSRRTARSRFHPAERFGFLLPGLAILIALNIFPMLYSLVVSVQHYTLSDVSGRHFVGLANFVADITNPSFQHALFITLLMTATTVLAQLFFGMVIALVLNRHDIVGRKVFSTIFLLPMAVSPLVVGILWRFMLNPSFGILSYFIDNIAGTHVDLLTHPVTAVIALLVTYTWAWTPFTTLFLYSALLGVEKEYREAAEIDGAKNLRIIWSVEIPIIKNLVVLVVLLQTIAAFRMFTEPVLMTNGGPGISTQTLSYLVWQQGLNYFDMGTASSMSWIMVVIASVFAGLFLKFGHFEV